jgi:hypothetical protein
MRKSKTKIIPYVDPEKTPFIKIMYTFEIESYEEFLEKIEKDELKED